MKLKILFSLLASSIIFFACDDTDISDDYLPAAIISPSVDKVTLFDAPFTCDFTVSNEGVTSFAITGGDGEKTVSISDLKGSAEFTETDFGTQWEIGGALDYTTTIDFGSNLATQSFSISVIDALDASVEGTASVQNDSTKVYITLAGETMYKAMGEVAVSKKVITETEPNPDFALIESVSSISEYEYLDSIMGPDYNVSDTIVYQIKAVSGTNSETKSVTIPVEE